MTSLGAALTSPAKLAFAGYVILAYSGRIHDGSLCQVLVVAGVFILLQVFHDDYFRIVLNRWAEKGPTIPTTASRRLQG